MSLVQVPGEGVGESSPDPRRGAHWPSCCFSASPGAWPGMRSWRGQRCDTLELALLLSSRPPGWAGPQAQGSSLALGCVQTLQDWHTSTQLPELPAPYFSRSCQDRVENRPPGTTLTSLSILHTCQTDRP